jgi:hypothetical protein
MRTRVGDGKELDQAHIKNSEGAREEQTGT